VLLEELAQADHIDWDQTALDSAAVPAPVGQERGKNPTDRGKTQRVRRTKRHLVVDAHGIPLAVLVSAANVRDSMMILATVDAVEPIRAKTRGSPRYRPHKLHADKGYDYRHFRLALRKRCISPASPAVMSSPGTTWDATGGWSNGRSPGSPASGA
jgi:hypothetical protein